MIDAVVVYAGQHAYRRSDDVAVVPPVRVAHDVWWLPLIWATLKSWRSNARTTLMPETDGSGGIRPPQ
jgi:hypothetical protein